MFVALRAGLGMLFHFVSLVRSGRKLSLLFQRKIVESHVPGARMLPIRRETESGLSDADDMLAGGGSERIAWHSAQVSRWRLEHADVTLERGCYSPGELTPTRQRGAGFCGLG